MRHFIIGQGIKSDSRLMLICHSHYWYWIFYLIDWWMCRSFFSLFSSIFILFYLFTHVIYFILISYDIRLFWWWIECDLTAHTFISFFHRFIPYLSYFSIVSTLHAYINQFHVWISRLSSLLITTNSNSHLCMSSSSINLLLK